jgi:hypothetical protein
MGWGTFAFSAGTHLVAPSCSTCSCSQGTPSGGDCPEEVTVSAYGQTSCIGAAAASPASGACGPVTASAARGALTSATNGSCGTVGGGKRSPPYFATQVTGCTAAGGVPCGAGTCVPPAAKICVYSAGVAPCPAGYPTEVVYSGTISDTSTCGSCSCAATGAMCTPTVTFYADSACTTSLGSVTNPATCAVFGVPAASFVITNPGTAMGGSCAPFGGSLSGTASASGTTYTVCCP